MAVKVISDQSPWKLSGRAGAQTQHPYSQTRCSLAIKGLNLHCIAKHKYTFFVTASRNSASLKQGKEPYYTMSNF